jgi:hypothetical protein
MARFYLYYGTLHDSDMMDEVLLCPHARHRKLWRWVRLLTDAIFWPPLFCMKSV